MISTILHNTLMLFKFQWGLQLSNTNPPQVNAYANKLTWAKRSFSDCLAILNAYGDWSKAHRDEGFLVLHLQNAWKSKTILVFQIHTTSCTG